jgi:hypothetical protein
MNCRATKDLSCSPCLACHLLALVHLAGPGSVTVTPPEPVLLRASCPWRGRGRGVRLRVYFVRESIMLVDNLEALLWRR